MIYANKAPIPKDMIEKGTRINIYFCSCCFKPGLKNIDNSNWIGKEHIFNIDFKVGDAPLNKLYAENLIRGYIIGKNLRIVNGTSEEVSFFDTEKQNAFTIGPNDEITIDYSKDAKWFFEVESQKLKLEMVAWMPLK